MIIFKEAGALHRHLQKLRAAGHTIGFVPTMGALHEGHLSLIKRSRQSADITVCSIFVNPTQFNDPADFEKYPLTNAADTRLLVKEETDLLFLPGISEVYPEGTAARQHYPLGYLETVLEGAHRPGHFQGVCQVVHRLLEIVQPHQLFLGQKDFQQCMVLKKLVDLLALPIEVVIGETLREPSGLAMSSRNLRLSPRQKEQATAIYQSLEEIRRDLGQKGWGQLREAAIARLRENDFDKIDYVAIAEADTLRLLGDDETPVEGRPLVALIAAFMGEVRLIDNRLLNGC